MRVQIHPRGPGVADQVQPTVPLHALGHQRLRLLLVRDVGLLRAAACGRPWGAADREQRNVVLRCLNELSQQAVA